LIILKKRAKLLNVGDYQITEGVSMLDKKIWIGVIVAFLIFLSAHALVSYNLIQYGGDEHVYYGYVPPSTDIVPHVTELIGGNKINYTVPSGVAILDVVGLKDNTYIEVWDIYANTMLYSETINKFEKKFFYIPVGLFFKVVASERVAAMLTGGADIYLSDSGVFIGGTSTFYPAVTGGFRGKEFIFMAAPGTHMCSYSKERIGYNFYLMALEGTDWHLSDLTPRWSASEHLKPRGISKIVLSSRMNYLGLSGGTGNNVVFHLTTTGDVMVSCSALGDYVAVPAITGGYVGKLFYAPISVTFDEEGLTAAFIVFPLEEGKVTVYDESLNVIAERTFTVIDVENRDYWYYNLGLGRFNIIVESTGNICLMVGQTDGYVEIEYLGDDITFLGAKPNQEIRFFAPTMAVLFAPEDLTVSIDGSPPTPMKKDEFRFLESGAHSVVADKHIIVEILASGGGWEDWGSYLIEPLDIDLTFEVPESFLAKTQDYMSYITYAIIVVVIAAVVIILRRRKR